MTYFCATAIAAEAGLSDAEIVLAFSVATAAFFAASKLVKTELTVLIIAST